MELSGITDIGKVRQQNQDVYRTLYDERSGIAVLVVCDGMGGANAGNIASETAAETFMAFMSGYLAQSNNWDSLSLIMGDAVLAANSAVYQRSLLDPECMGMGTTLVAAAVCPDSEVVVNIGDSRAYHVTDDTIRQITKDHSVVENMVARGELSREAAKDHPNKNLITRALGTGWNEEPDVFFTGLRAGEYLLLCSDGLTNTVPDREIHGVLRRGDTINSSCRQLVSLALSRGAPDNVTVVLLRK